MDNIQNQNNNQVRQKIREKVQGKVSTHLQILLPFAPESILPREYISENFSLIWWAERGIREQVNKQTIGAVVRRQIFEHFQRETEHQVWYNVLNKVWGKIGILNRLIKENT